MEGRQDRTGRSFILEAPEAIINQGGGISKDLTSVEESTKVTQQKKRAKNRTKVPKSIQVGTDSRRLRRDLAKAWGVFTASLHSLWRVSTRSRARGGVSHW